MRISDWSSDVCSSDLDWRYGDVQRPDQYAGEHWHKARAEVSAFIPAGQRDHPYWASNEPCSMHIDEVEAIWSAIAQRDDWQPFNAKIRSAERRVGKECVSPSRSRGSLYH